jgi:hypothetical protein
MANRRFEQFTYSLVKKLTFIVGKATYVSGSTSWVLNEGPGVTGITVDGAGDYNLILQDKYSALLFAKFSIQKASAADLVAQIKSETVATTKIIEFKTLAVATATAPANGDVIYFELCLRNSSVA